MEQVSLWSGQGGEPADWPHAREELTFSPVEVLRLETELLGFSVTLYAIPPDSSDPDTIIRVAESLTLVDGN